MWREDILPLTENNSFTKDSLENVDPREFTKKHLEKQLLPNLKEQELAEIITQKVGGRNPDSGLYIMYAHN